jgi:hypothetical protein
VGGKGVALGGTAVGDAKTDGRLGVPPEQALSAKRRMIQTRFRFDILMIISDVWAVKRSKSNST